MQGLSAGVGQLHQLCQKLEILGSARLRIFEKFVKISNESEQHRAGLRLRLVKEITRQKIIIINQNRAKERRR